MLIINKHLPASRGLAATLRNRAASVSLDWDTRSKSRFDAHDSSGRHIAVFLPRGTVLRGGDMLVAEDGSFVRVEAAPQTVLQVRACAEHGAATDLPRAAYHLGNRHVQLEVQADCLQFEPDPVLAGMLRRMHLIVTEVQAPFEPEAGAYGDGGHAHNDHGHHHHDHPDGEHAHAHHHGEHHAHDGHSH